MNTPSRLALEIVQLLADPLDDRPRVLQFQLEVHDFVDVLEFALVRQPLLLQEVLDLLLVGVLQLVVGLSGALATFSFFRKNSRIYCRVFSTGMNFRHSSNLICISLLISSSRFMF
jgi:hypothetical protein